MKIIKMIYLFYTINKITYLSLNNMRPFRVDIKPRVLVEPKFKEAQGRGFGASYLLACLPVDHRYVLVPSQIFKVKLERVNTRSALASSIHSLAHFLGK